MEKIEGISLEDLVVESASELIADKRRQAAGIIKQQLQRIEQLSGDIKQLEKQVRQKREKLEKAQAKINKIKAGDWSLLAEGKKDGEGE